MHIESVLHNRAPESVHRSHTSAIAALKSSIQERQLNPRNSDEARALTRIANPADYKAYSHDEAFKYERNSNRRRLHHYSISLQHIITAYHYSIMLTISYHTVRSVR
eukprot:IDg4900t1